MKSATQVATPPLTVHWLTGVPEALIGVFIFRLTAPTMRIALQDFHPAVVGMGRLLIAAVPAAIILLIMGSPRLNLRQMGSLLVTALCAYVGFSWLMATALRTVPSYHAGIVIGGIPLATAIFASLRNRQHQPLLFWVAALAGSFFVVAYGFVNSGFQVVQADLLLLLSAGLAGLGYVEGSRLSQEIGTNTITCWLPIVAAPFALLLCYDKMPAEWSGIHLNSWLALLYNGLFSSLIGFFLWYRGLSRGGTARIGQIQLAQPFFTLAAAAVILHESLSLFDWLTAGAVVACISVTQIASPRRRVL